MKWEMKKLGDVCNFSNGLWTGKKPPFLEVSVIRNTNFTKDCQLDSTDIVQLMVEKSQYEKRKLQFGDIILEKSGGGPKQAVGRVVIFDKQEGEFSFSNFTSVVRIKNKNLIDFQFLHKFLFYTYISGETEKMQTNSTGIRNLKFDDYKDIQIPVPQLIEQQRIVNILDEAFAALDQAKDNLQRNVQNAKDLFQSELNQIFMQKGADWVEALLGNVTTKIGSGATPRGGNESYKTEGISLVRSMNVHDSYFKPDKLAFIDEKQAKELANVMLEANDVLFNITGASVARCCTMPQIYLPARVNQHVSILRPKKTILNANFLNFMLISKFYKDQLLATGEQGATRQAITKVQLQNFKIHYPPLNQQEALIERLDALSAETQQLKKLYEQKLIYIETLKKSLLQKAFSGGL